MPQAGHVKMLEEGSRRDKAVLAAECRKNLKFLCKEVLGMQQWEDALHNDLLKFLESSGGQKLILMPRGHLKTSIITVGWTIQQMLRNPNIRILINNAVWDNARKILNQISEYLTYKSALPMIFGQFKSPRCRWTQDEIEIDQKTSGTGKEATITTGGIETARTGLHFDLIIHDDLVERNNVGTKEQIQKVITFYRDSLDLLDPGGTMVVVGTRWALGDLYGHILESEIGSINGQKLEGRQWRELVPAV